MTFLYRLLKYWNDARAVGNGRVRGYSTKETVLDAADEIERLRAELAEAAEQIKLMAMTPEEVNAWLDSIAAIPDRHGFPSSGTNPPPSASY